MELESKNWKILMNWHDSARWKQKMKIYNDKTKHIVFRRIGNTKRILLHKILVDSYLLKTWNKSENICAGGQNVSDNVKKLRFPFFFQTFMQKPFIFDDFMTNCNSHRRKQRKVKGMPETSAHFDLVYMSIT